MILAVNHRGDSDSTGSIAGHIQGTLHAPEANPERWLNELDLPDEFTRMAEDPWLLANGKLDTGEASASKS